PCPQRRCSFRETETLRVVYPADPGFHPLVSCTEVGFASLTPVPTRGPDVKLAVIFDNFFKFNGGLQFIARLLHVLSGIAWIGLLYFFNFVQTPSFAELSPGARNEAFDKLTWRALWWFRWAAMSTFFFGLIMLGIYSSDSGKNGTTNYLSPTHATGASILTGVLFAVTML